MTVVLAVIGSAIALVVLAGILAAMAFFIGIVGYGWYSVLAPEEELRALPPGRRKWVMARATLAVALLWLLLLSDNTSSRNTRRRMDGNETYLFFYRLMRRLAGLPPRSPFPTERSDAPQSGSAA